MCTTPAPARLTARHVAATLLILLAVASPAPAEDALDEALAQVGLARRDLGWSPKAWWPRFPDVPYKLRAFDALFAEPLDTITYGRALAQTAREMLDPATLNERSGRYDGRLFQAVQRLGVDPKFGGFRGYSANLLAPETPLDEALLKLHEIAGHPTRISTFGMELPYPTPRDDLRAAVGVLPEGVSPILGQLVLNIVDAQHWAQLAFRKVDGNDRLVASTRFDVGTEMIDAYDYCPAMDDVARRWDEASLWYAGQKCTEALDLARAKLQALTLDEPPSFTFDWETPWGWVRVRGGDADTIHATNELLIVDLGGDDRYFGAVAASTAQRPIGLLLDIAGDDLYRSAEPAQGAGLCGVGVLLDAAGDDHYEARRYAQGVGQFGLGLCADLGGQDTYFTRFSGQGCGYFGIGLLFDLGGPDNYRIFGDGQGLGGVSGVGVLADRDGDDRYVAERKHSVTGRPSYHSPGLDISVSNVQGCGMGRRGDGSDGHSWAGGLGALLDGAGDDYYSAGNWSMGTGYWFGIGVLHDWAGDDEYHGVIYSQGTGAHFCIGACIEEAGDDKHLAEGNSNESLAWAHDFTVGILLDVAGNDEYSVKTSGLAYAINRSFAFLFDTGGNDQYQTDHETRRATEDPRPGMAVANQRFGARDGVSTYFADTTSLALFLDIGGDDTYWGTLDDDMIWSDPVDSPNWQNRNFSIGVDRPKGTIDFTPIPVRAPSGRPRDVLREVSPASAE